MGRAIASRKTAVGETVERLAGIAVIHLGKCWNHGINVSHSFCIVGLEKKNPKKQQSHGIMYNFTNCSCWKLYKKFEYVLTFLWEYSIIVLIRRNVFGFVRDVE